MRKRLLDDCARWPETLALHYLDKRAFQKVLSEGELP
jgi:hypothetical protein